MKRTTLLIGLFVTLMLGSAQALLAQTILATVVESSGIVEVLRPNDDYEPRPAPKGTTLKDGELIRVQPDSEAVVRCSGSSLTRYIPDDGVARGIADFCS